MGGESETLQRGGSERGPAEGASAAKGAIRWRAERGIGRDLGKRVPILRRFAPQDKFSAGAPRAIRPIRSARALAVSVSWVALIQSDGIHLENQFSAAHCSRLP